MTSFDDLGVVPDLIDALVRAGIEEPTEFQGLAIPVLLRGNSLLAQAGPGAGTLMAYGLPLLHRVDPEARSPRALVLAPSVEAASRLAASLSGLAQASGHKVGALEAGWAVPEMASILFATPEDLLKAVKSSRIPLDVVEAVVVDGFSTLSDAGREALETVFESLPRDGLRILLSQPLTAEAEGFGRAHFAKAVHIPPKPAQAGTDAGPPDRGEVRYRIVGDDKETQLLQTLAASFDGGAHHALLFFRSDDQAADFGDFLSLHGYSSGPVGDAAAPVWLATADLPARQLLKEWPDSAPVVTVSVEVPPDPDSLDRRHGTQEGGLILVRPRELPHLKDLARRAGYRLIPGPEPVSTRISGELERLRALLERAIKEEELAPYFLALEPLFQDYSPGEVAAAAAALLQRKQALGKASEPRVAPGISTEARSGPPPKTWARLFVAVGEKDGVGPGDLLGAIAGEAGVEGSQVGKIEIRETFSLVEVVANVADRVIRGLNGTSIRGRSVRVDHDRGGSRGRGGVGPRSKRQGPRDRPRDR